VVDALARLPRPSQDGLRWSGPEQWHITLRFFGEIAHAEVGAATRALELAVLELPGTLAAQGGPGTRFLGPGLVIWPVEGLAAAALAVERASAGIGAPPRERPFFGHITLARGRRGADLRKARHLLCPLTESWPVGSLTLVQSELHTDGARYRVLEDIPLAGAG
jgi:2'-5' RNA ligase